MLLESWLASLGKKLVRVLLKFRSLFVQVGGVGVSGCDEGEPEAGSPGISGTDFNILEYADADLDTGDEGATSTVTEGVDASSRLLTVDIKPDKTTSDSVAEEVNEFHTTLLEFTQKQNQQQQKPTIHSHLAASDGNGLVGSQHHG